MTLYEELLWGCLRDLPDEGLKQIPFKEPLIYDLIFVLHEETLKSFSVRSFINLLLTRSGQPVLENK